VWRRLRPFLGRHLNRAPTHLLGRFLLTYLLPTQLLRTAYLALYEALAHFGRVTLDLALRTRLARPLRARRLRVVRPLRTALALAKRARDQVGHVPCG
jgi:hypothetical protein